MEAGSSDGDFHRFPWNRRICGARFGFLWISSIFGDLMWICVDFMIPRGSVILDWIFNGFHRFWLILGGFVWIPRIPGARGRTRDYTGLHGSGGPLTNGCSDPSKFGQISGSMTSKTR